MMKFLKLRYHGEKGFTLVELLVVIAILGALAAIAILNIVQFIGRGEEEANQTDQYNIQVAVLALLADAGVHVLDKLIYEEVDTLAEVQEVQAGNGAHSLDEYLVGEPYPLRQVYNISEEGLVTVHSD